MQITKHFGIFSVFCDLLWIASILIAIFTLQGFTDMEKCRSPHTFEHVCIENTGFSGAVATFI
jgi:hypothetical protein